ncbi:MAG: branched-chain amino acid ABC transporter permease [Synergistaceae bacterium]|nr:branched-chain amino acid ABC transporter permease [Synergistaceae bacterium]
MSSYMISVATQIIIQAIAACGLNVIVGYAGQISLGHAAFVGIGAYSNAMLTTAGGLTFWQALPISLLIVGLVGLLCGLPSLRVKEDFLAITTIGINFIVVAIFQYTPALGGALGIGGIPRVRLFSMALNGQGFFILCLVCLAIVMMTCWFFTKSWTGLSCFAVREEETAASSMGVSPVRAKLTAFVLGTIMAGLSGALYAHYMRFINADSFSFTFSVTLLSIAVAGGLGTFWGPLVGAVVLGVLPEIFRPLVDYRMLLYATLLLMMIRFLPGGLLGGVSVMSRKNLKIKKDKLAAKGDGKVE